MSERGLKALREFEEKADVSAGAAMVEVSGLRHRYAGRLVISLDRWRASPGAHWLVLGASGSGKTTLLYLLAGLLSPEQGK